MMFTVSGVDQEMGIGLSDGTAQILQLVGHCRVLCPLTVIADPLDEMNESRLIPSLERPPAVGLATQIPRNPDQSHIEWRRGHAAQDPPNLGGCGLVPGT